MVANYNRFDVLNDGTERPAGPLLEIYNPILQPWSGEVVAVIEFYEHAQDLEEALANARLRSWLAVAAATAAFFLILSIIVFRGSRTIDRQAHELKDKVAELTTLHRRVKGATQRATSLNERYLRRLGADLHDGPAQLVALASLRLDSGLVQASDAGGGAREQELKSIRANLEEALQEIRSICHGLVLPYIETAGLIEVMTHAIDAYERRTGTKVERQLQDVVSFNIPLSQRICVYRFLQEALNNGFRHCRGASQLVRMTTNDKRLTIAVSDDGKGFDPEELPADSIGIAAMRERIESLGGNFALETSGAGTTVTMTLEIEEVAEG
jgi:signal transduction histidine kinase